MVSNIIDVKYAQGLAKTLGREDIQIVTADWINDCKWRGNTFSQIAIEEHTMVQGKINQAQYLEAMTRITKHRRRRAK